MVGSCREGAAVGQAAGGPVISRVTVTTVRS